MNKPEKAYKGCGWSAIAALLLMIAWLIIGASCTTTKYVSVPEVHTDTVRITSQQYDSIFVHDSIYQKEKGDTFLIERWHTRYKEKLVHDTIYQHRIDSIPSPYPVEVKVEKQLSWWQRLRLGLGNIMLALIGMAVLYGAAKIYLKLHPL